MSKYSRSQVFAKRALYKRKPTSSIAVCPAATTKTVEVKGAKNGGSRVIAAAKAPRFYAAEDVAVPKKNRKHAGVAKLRNGIVPGTVLILLAGRFRGKRVVFLKQLESGLLLVSGPFKVNGVPLKRVNQAYVIATSTKVELDASKVRPSPVVSGGFICFRNFIRFRSRELSAGETMDQIVDIQEGAQSLET